MLSEGFGREAWMIKLKLSRRTKVKKVGCLDILTFLFLFLITQILCWVGREFIYIDKLREGMVGIHNVNTITKNPIETSNVKFSCLKLC